MKLYLVRWPDLSISLVHARDEDELVSTLDEVADPSGCKWKVYNGPLHLDFKLKIDFQDQSDYKKVPFRPSAKITALDETFEIRQYGFEDNDSDTITDMWNAITKKAFPHLWLYYNGVPTDVDEAAKEFEEAVLAELRQYHELEFNRRFRGADQPFKSN